MSGVKTSWASLGTRTAPASSGKFRRIIAGEPLKIAFTPHYEEAQVIWYENRSYRQGTPEYQKALAAGERPKSRVFAQALDVASGEMIMLDLAFSTAEDVKNAIQKYGETSVLEITRTGQGKDSRYRVMFERQMTQDEAKRVASAPKPDDSADKRGPQLVSGTV